MTNLPFTARNVTKFVARSIVAAKTAQLTAEAIADHTEYETDDTIVEIGSGVVGWYVAHKLQPVTDAVVDRTADFVTAKREARKAKKNAKKDQK